MLSSSLLFLFRFLPIAFASYYITPNKYKNFLLVILSLIFYGWGEPRYVLIMLMSIACDYSCGRLIEAHRDNKKIMRTGLIISIVFNLGMLCFFKYTNFFIENINAVTGLSIDFLSIALPLGISFYTFQTMSYTIDVYRGNVKAATNLVDFSAFVVLFPQLIAGPIVRYTDVMHELHERKITMEDINIGARTFVFGLAKKVLIANNIGLLWDETGALGFANISTPLAWLGIIGFAFQIYFDFSGYSSMAIGLGRMLGFKFPQNFDYPYISTSMTEFWRRWHMTLGSWFREYLYIPLGGNRCGKWRNVFNLFVVWAATGFWHGASWNFVFWGLFFFVLLLIERAGLKKSLDSHKALSRLYMFILLCVSWALFDITNFSDLTLFLNRMFIPKGGSDWVYFLQNYGVTLGICAICSTPLPQKLYEKVKKVPLFDAFIVLILLALSVAYLVDSTYNPFLYFRF